VSRTAGHNRSGHGTPNGYRLGCRCARCRQAWHTYATGSSAADGPERLIAARTTDVFARVDAARKAFLTYVVKVLGHCQFCGATLSDKILSRHPGVCFACHKHGKRLDVRDELARRAG
jgi:predicted RNA-binding Zn-ribbon protein involved in translation (DUF1610 family)